jgi:hypothetical protein
MKRVPNAHFGRVIESNWLLTKMRWVLPPQLAQKAIHVRTSATRPNSTRMFTQSNEFDRGHIRRSGLTVENAL